MWLTVRLPWCLLVAAIVLIGIHCSNGQLPRASESEMESEGTSHHTSLPNLGEILVLSKVHDTGEVSTRQELVAQLKRNFRKLISFPTALSNGVGISHQCVEDSLFYVENLFVNQASWALQSIKCEMLNIIEFYS